MPTPTRKVLLLHGYAQNSIVFNRKISAIKKQCAKDIEFVFIDAPLILQPADLWGPIKDLEPTAPASDNPDPELIARGWWLRDGKVYTGLEDTLEYMRQILAKGVFGFSQGAVLASLICAILERPHLYPSFIVDDTPIHPPLDFAVFVSGFKPIHEATAHLFNEKLQTPSLHVVGRNDLIISIERSTILSDAFINPRVERHDGGHFIPAKASWRHFFRAWLASTDPAYDGAAVPSPTGTVARSPERSGQATPVATDPSESKL